MCKWGTDTETVVIMPPELSSTGALKIRRFGIDSCIADLVDALNMAGIYTSQSCCGHGERDGEIYLHDGRVLIIQQPATTPPAGGQDQEDA